MLHNLLKVKNISAKEASILLPIIFNQLVSLRHNLEAVIGDIRSLELSIRDLVDPDGEAATAPFREQGGQVNIPDVVNILNVDGDYTDTSRGSSDGGVYQR